MAWSSKRAARIDVRDRAAARADRVDVEDRYGDGETRDLRFARRARARGGDERAVGRRAAHLERDRVAEPRDGGEMRRRDDAARGT